MANGGIDSHEFFSALDDLSKERRIDKQRLFNAIEQALISAYKKNFGKNANVRATIDPDKGEVEVMSRKTVVETVEDPRRRCLWRRPAPSSRATRWATWSRCR